MKCKHEPIMTVVIGGIVKYIYKHYELKDTGYILCLECGKQMSKEELK